MLPTNNDDKKEKGCSWQWDSLNIMVLYIFRKMALSYENVAEDWSSKSQNKQSTC